MSLSYLLQYFILFPASSFLNIALFVAQNVLYPRIPSSPARRTDTQHLTTFNRPTPGAVIYDVSQPHVVTITVPPHSTWTSGLYWHEKHTKYLHVVEGLARITLNSNTSVYGPSDGIIEVPMFTIHEWQREAKGYARVDGEERRDLVVREWTMPANGQKEMFIRMLNSYLMESDPQRLHRWLPLPPFLVTWLEQYVVLLQLLVIYRAKDHWPTFDEEAEHVDWQTWAVTHVYLRLAGLVGKSLGLEGQYPEYVGANLARKPYDPWQSSRRRLTD